MPHKTEKVFVSDLGNLTDEQLDELIIRLFNMKETLEKERDGEGEEAVPLDSLASQQLQVLKKDAEEVGNVDLGMVTWFLFGRPASDISYKLEKV